MLEIKTANQTAIEYACKMFHYAKRVPVGRLTAYNIYEDNNWCGVVIYGSGANNSIASPFGLVQGEVMELVRVALNGKQKHTSQVVSATIKQIKKDLPIVKLLISYADNEQNHLGIIYQATNWYYISNADIEPKIFLDGKRMHRRSLYSKFKTSSIPRLKDILGNRLIIEKNNIANIKFKYIYPLDKKLIPMCKKMSKPYPKKEKQDNE